MSVPARWLQSAALLPMLAGFAAAEELPAAPQPEGAAAEPAAAPVGAVVVHLSQNDPNPFAEATEIRFALGERALVSLGVFDISGRRVRTLAEGILDAGEHSASWDGRDFLGEAVSAGIYFYRLEGEGIDETRKLVVLR
ncbi:MAG: FlgD immunoglobulin-like domain containing protein [Candidatus Eiseniibacteriota bacterium]